MTKVDQICPFSVAFNRLPHEAQHPLKNKQFSSPRLYSLSISAFQEVRDANLGARLSWEYFLSRHEDIKFCIFLFLLSVPQGMTLGWMNTVAFSSCTIICTPDHYLGIRLVFGNQGQIICHRHMRDADRTNVGTYVSVFQ